MKTWMVLGGLLVACLGWAQDLPVSKVVLFTSGVGYFEHRGSVSGDATVPFSFSENQINDVLKSLILRDPSGQVGAVGYPSQDPLERTLGSFSVDLAGPGGLAALLPQLRGVFLSLTTPAEVTGRLVGLDARGPADKPETMLTVATDDGLRVVPLSSVTGLKILDPKVDRDLAQALLLVAGSRDERRKTVTIGFKGTGSRQVSVGYIAEAPVWKTSYRLDLTGGKPFLQAWAIVENTGDSDWNQVKLSLVSGRPVSFIQDLYTPLYVERPVYAPATDAGAAPRQNEAAMDSAPAPAPAPMASAAPAPMMAFEAKRAKAEDDVVPLRESNVRPQASGGSAGELFQFTLASPLSLARHRSALIPLTATDVDAKKVSVYNPTIDRLHPQNAVQLTNTTGLRLPAGPITIYDGGTYAGDALTDTLVEKDRRLWTYATDLAVRADVAETNAQTTTKISLVRGVLNTRKELTWTTVYSLANAGAEARSLLVEHPVRSDRTLLAPTAAEKTPDWYRFSVDVAAGGKADLTVKESRTIVETLSVANWRAEQLVALVASSSPLSPGAKAALQKLAELRMAADRTLQTANDTEKKLNDLAAGQGRLRDNLEAVGRDSAQGQTYLKKLMDSDDQIDQLTKDLAQARQLADVAQKTVEDAVRNLTID